jgi:hypothetical protein
MSPGTHFSFLELLIAFVLIIGINLLGLVAKTIGAYWQLFARNLKEKNKQLYDMITLRVELTTGVGMIEQLLYTYAFVSGFREFIGGVLLFKAFFGWLELKKSRADLAGEEQLQKQLTAEGQPGADHASFDLTLMRFYAYAIGNFISLAYAIAAYEIAHLLVRSIAVISTGPEQVL